MTISERIADLGVGLEAELAAIGDEVVRLGGTWPGGSRFKDVAIQLAAIDDVVSERAAIVSLAIEQIAPEVGDTLTYNLTVSGVPTPTIVGSALWERSEDEGETWDTATADTSTWGDGDRARVTVTVGNTVLDQYFTATLTSDSVEVVETVTENVVFLDLIADSLTPGTNLATLSGWSYRASAQSSDSARHIITIDSSPDYFRRNGANTNTTSAGAIFAAPTATDNRRIEIEMRGFPPGISSNRNDFIVDLLRGDTDGGVNVSARLSRTNSVDNVVIGGSLATSVDEGITMPSFPFVFVAEIIGSEVRVGYYPVGAPESAVLWATTTISGSPTLKNISVNMVRNGSANTTDNGSPTWTRIIGTHILSGFLLPAS